MVYDFCKRASPIYFSFLRMVERKYGHYYSPTTVSNITKRTEHLVEEFHERKFNYSQYVCVFLDATYIPLRRGTVEREAVNVAIGFEVTAVRKFLTTVSHRPRTEPLGLNYSRDYAHGGLKIFSCSSPTV